MIDDALPIAASAIRARRRPRVLAGLWAWQAVLALLGTWPAVALARAAYGHSPTGDAPLWEPGALPLLGLLSRETNAVRAAGGAAIVVLALGAMAGLVPLAAAMVSIAHTTRDGHGIGGARAVGAAVRFFRPLALLLLAMTLAQATVVAAAILFGQLAEGWAHGSLGEAHAQMLGVAVGAALMPCLAALGVTHDLARAAVVRFNLRPMHAIVTGSLTLRAAPLAVGWSWTWRALASWVPVVVVAAVAGRMGGRGGLALWALAALHQAVVFTRVGLRASWLAKALRTVDAKHAPSGFTDSMSVE